MNKEPRTSALERLLALGRPGADAAVALRNAYPGRARVEMAERFLVMWERDRCAGKEIPPIAVLVAVRDVARENKPEMLATQEAFDWLDRLPNMTIDGRGTAIAMALRYVKPGRERAEKAERYLGIWKRGKSTGMPPMPEDVIAAVRAIAEENKNLEALK